MFEYDKKRNKFVVYKQGQSLLAEDMLNENVLKATTCHLIKLGIQFTMKYP